MKSIRRILLPCIFFALTGMAGAAPTMAFGYLHNKSGNRNFGYLETIFPNSFANSIKSIFNVNVLKPPQVDEKLKKRKRKLELSYKPYELPELVDAIGADFFIYGHFTPLPDNKIQIVLNLYQGGSNRIFTFNNIGTMETEIFKLVDRVTMILINFLSRGNLYRSEVLSPQTARLGILTNLSGTELNALYSLFLEKGYSLAGVQGNTIHNHVDDRMIDRFLYMTSELSSFDIITDRRKLVFPVGTWAGVKHEEKVARFKELYKRYDEEYLVQKRELMRKLRSACHDSFNKLLVIGFNRKRTEGWVRCYDLPTQDIVWMQTNITGANMQEICRKMLSEMNANIKNPFEK